MTESDPNVSHLSWDQVHHKLTCSEMTWKWPLSLCRNIPSRVKCVETLSRLLSVGAAVAPTGGSACASGELVTQLSLRLTGLAQQDQRVRTCVSAVAAPAGGNACASGK